MRKINNQDFKNKSIEIYKILSRMQAYIGLIKPMWQESDKEDLAFVSEMQMKQADLLRAYSVVQDYCMDAMAINDKQTVAECRTLESIIFSTMEEIGSLYM